MTCDWWYIVGDKRNQTYVAGCSGGGDILPLQAVICGLTKESLPQFPQAPNADGYCLSCEGLLDLVTRALCKFQLLSGMSQTAIEKNLPYDKGGWTRCFKVSAGARREAPNIGDVVHALQLPP